LENLKGRDHLEDIGIDGRIVLEWILRKQWEGVDCMYLAQDKDWWHTVVNAVMYLWVP
jgi:hypothetical protein